MTTIQLPISLNGIENNLEIINDTLFLTGEIKIDVATTLVQNMMSIEARNRDLENNGIIQSNEYPILTIIINSPGGDLNAGWMICDLMDQMKTPIETFALGQAASAGLMIFMNGTKGLRKATPNTQIMSHRYSIGLEISHADIKSQMPELDRIHERIINHYIKCTGLSRKKILKELLTEHNVWLDATECKNLNICDVVPNDYFGTKKSKKGIKK